MYTACDWLVVFPVHSKDLIKDLTHLTSYMSNINENAKELNTEHANRGHKTKVSFDIIDGYLLFIGKKAQIRWQLSLR